MEYFTAKIIYLQQHLLLFIFMPMHGQDPRTLTFFPLTDDFQPKEYVIK